MTARSTLRYYSTRADQKTTGQRVPPAPAGDCPLFVMGPGGTTLRRCVFTLFVPGVPLPAPFVLRRLLSRLLSLTLTGALADVLLRTLLVPGGTVCMVFRLPLMAALVRDTRWELIDVLWRAACLRVRR
jgi:hypothetical protein